MAFRLAVYASQSRLPISTQDSLLSVGQLFQTGLNPQGSQRKVSVIRLDHDFPPFLTFLTQDGLGQQWLVHYHSEKPHQGIGNVLILANLPPPAPIESFQLNDVVCHELLGGLLKHYERRAA